MKTFRYIPLTLLLIGSTATPLTPITLNPTIVAIMDGRSFGIDGKKIASMYNMIRRIQDILIGKKNAKGDRIGLYAYKGLPHCARSLLKIEKALLEELQNPTTTPDRNMMIEQELAAIHQILATMLADFKKIVDPFMADARSAKEPLVILIEEECKKREKPHSMLLEWANLVDELEGFERKFSTLAIFNEFCEDLITFLTDLIHNCKKGREQFEKLLKEYQKQS